MKLASIGLTGEVGPWAALGFVPDGSGRIRLANGALEFGWDVPGLSVEPGDGEQGPTSPVDGLVVAIDRSTGGMVQRNGAVELDHIVVMTDSIARTSEAIHAGLGLEQRRVRETPDVRQAFHRFVDQGTTRGCIVELVEDERAQVPTIWGVVVIVADLDALASGASGLVGSPRPAVQPGRRIATVRRKAGLTTAVAFMDR